MTNTITINEMGLRDGLQNHHTQVSTHNKSRLAKALVSAGICEMEPVSFVHPKAVPAMADAAELTRMLPQKQGVNYTALVPNLKGYALAKDAGYQRISIVISTTDSFNQRNLNMSLSAAKESTKAIIAAAKQDGLATRTYISGALVCPYDGPVLPATSQRLAEEMLEAGTDEIVIADTVGGGRPPQLQAILSGLLRTVESERLSVHLHDTRGLAQTLAWVACELGIRKFDASIGGLGGCPFAPGATGNVATEDLVYLFESAGFDTGIDMDKLQDALAVAREVANDAHLGGRISRYLESQKQAGRPCTLY